MPGPIASKLFGYCHRSLVLIRLVTLSFVLCAFGFSAQAQNTQPQDQDVENQVSDTGLASTERAAGRSTVEVAISGLTQEQESAAQAIALRVALMRASFETNLMNSTITGSSLANVDDFILSSETRRPLDTDLVSQEMPMTRLVRETGRITHIVVVTMDTSAIDQLINEAEQELKARRESSDEELREPVGQATLVWLLIRDSGREVIVTESNARNVVARAREIAGVNGMVLKFPVSDSTILSADSLLTGDASAILGPSRRYKPASVVVGVLDRSDGVSWSGSWRYFEDEESSEQSNSGKSLDAQLQFGLDEFLTAAETEELPSAPGDSAAEKGMLWVNTTDSSAAYIRLMSLMQGLGSVTRVFPEELASTGILFTVIPARAIDDINRASESISWLQRVNSTEVLVGSSTVPSGLDAYFQYIP